MHDPDHSDDEDRFVLLGFSSALRLLVVCHCYRTGEDIHSDRLGSEGDPQRTRDLRAMVEAMRKEYDFSRSEKNATRRP